MCAKLAIVKHVAALSAIVIVSAPAFSQPQSLSARPAVVAPTAVGAATLEEAFWICDYVATTQGMPYALPEACTFLHAEFKKQKFGNDGDELVKWWRERKAAEYLKLRMRENR